MAKNGDKGLTTIYEDGHKRHVCNRCDFKDYNNPKNVVGAVIVSKGKILLCRRAIAPRKGYWDLPGGFQEQGETWEDAVMRESSEEANATIKTDALLGIYELPHAGLTKIFFRAALTDPAIAPGPESLEVRLFRWKDIPWNELAFPVTALALQKYKATARMKNTFAPEHQTVPPAPLHNKP